MSRPNSVEDRALAALDRLVKRRPTNELLKAKMAAGHRIITPTSVAAEAGVNEALDQGTLDLGTSGLKFRSWLKRRSEARWLKSSLRLRLRMQG
jgi:hypothetical protein